MGLNKRRSLLIAALLVLTTVSVYSPSLRGDFLWDDDAYISQNTALANGAGLRDIWLKPGTMQQYYPLTFTAFWAEHHLWRLNPLGYHLTSVVGHALNAILLWAILEGLGLPGAWISAWLFALHPVEAESVAWMTELKNILSTFFYLLTTMFLLRADRSEHPWGPPYWLASFFFLCAILSKSVTVTLPISFLLISGWMKGSPDRRRLWQMLPFIGLGLAVGLFTLSYEHHLVGAQGYAWTFTFAQRLMIAGRAFLFYLGKLVYPAHLSFIYPRWSIDPGTLLGYALPALALALVGAVAYGTKWWGKVPFACLLFFVISLSPILGFTSFYFMRYSFVADHFQYLASLGMLSLFGWMLTRALARLEVPPCSPLGMMIVGMIGINLAMATCRQSMKYVDSMHLWQHTLSLNPNSAIAHHNVAIVFSERHDWTEAIAHLRTAEALDPSYAQTHLALAFFAVQAKRWDDARHQYAEAIRLGIRDPEILRDYAALQKR